MTTQIKSQNDFYTDFKNEVQDKAPDLTDFTDGSNLDILAGVSSTACSELTKLTVDLFMKTFFDTAHGPAITGNTDDLQVLAVDHFGSDFARPEAVSALVDVTFSRPSFTAGSVTILAGTVVKTNADASGVSQRFETILPVTMGPTTLTINATTRALVPGSAGNVDPTLIKNIETALTDQTIIVTNSLKATGGAEALADSDYREFIRNKIETLKGGTTPGIEALAKTIAGVVVATVIENEIAVKKWDIGSSAVSGPVFYIPETTLYIADANGSASDALINAVDTALENLRAAGVAIAVKGSTPLPVNWTAAITLNPSGPNFSTLENDASPILATMTAYLNTLPIGSSFIRRVARLVILSIWGPSGTNDLTEFSVRTPVGDVQAADNEKLKPGTLGII